MCRWIAYNGAPIYIDTLVTRPAHSLVEQSLNTEMNFKADGSLWAVNGDGFGVGWYSEKDEPGLFKDSTPAWSDENLHEICAHVKSPLFMAHIRATTTGAVQRSNSHPFKYKNWLFQHNGHLDKFETIRRDLQVDIAPEIYPALAGTTDSETFFLLALSYGLDKDVKSALQKTIERVRKAYKDNGIEEKFSLSCAIADGKTLYTFLYASGDENKSQYYSTEEACAEDISNDASLIPDNSVVLVSEPLDKLSAKWEEVTENSFLTIRGGKVIVESLMS